MLARVVALTNVFLVVTAWLWIVEHQPPSSYGSVAVSTDEIRKDVAKRRVQGIRIDGARGQPERLFVKGAVLRAEVAPYSP